MDLNPNSFLPRWEETCWQDENTGSIYHRHFWGRLGLRSLCSRVFSLPSPAHPLCSQRPEKFRKPQGTWQLQEPLMDLSLQNWSFRCGCSVWPCHFSATAPWLWERHTQLPVALASLTSGPWIFRDIISLSRMIYIVPFLIILIPSPSQWWFCKFGFLSYKCGQPEVPGGSNHWFPQRVSMWSKSQDLSP